MKKSMLCLVLSVLVVVSLLSACSDNSTKPKMSEFEDEELIQYITDSGITIPKDVGVDTIRGIITELEDDPEHPAPVLGYTPLSDLYEDIRNLLVEYEASEK